MKLKKQIIKIALVLTVLFSSCGTALQVKRGTIKKIASTSYQSFNAKSYKYTKLASIGGTIVDTTAYSHTTIAALMELKDVKKNQSTKISFRQNNDTTLVISYTDSLKNKRIKLYKGKLKKRGFFEIYFLREKIAIPPLFPIIYSKVFISRRRIGLVNNELVIEEYEEYGGNIFILAGGTFTKRQHYFKSE